MRAAPFYAASAAADADAATAEAKAKAAANTRRRWGSEAASSVQAASSEAASSAKTGEDWEMLAPHEGATPKAKAKPPAEVKPEAAGGPLVRANPAVEGGSDAGLVEPMAELTLEEQKEGQGISAKALKRQRQKAKKEAEKAAAAEGKPEAAGGPLVRVNPAVDGEPKAKDFTTLASGASSSKNPPSKVKPEAGGPLVRVNPADGGSEEEPLCLKGVPASYIPSKDRPMEEDEHGNMVPRASAVQCTKCGLWTRSFRFQWTQKIILEEKAVDWGSIDEEDDVEWVRNCIICLARTHNDDVGLAMKLIKQQVVKGPTKRSQAFAEARANIQQEWQFTTSVAADEEGKVSTKKMRKLVRADFCRMFAPLAAFIALKAAQLEGVKELCDEFNALSQKLAGLIGSKASQDEIDDCMKGLDDLEPKIEAKSRMLAWEDKGPEQDEYLRACEYADEWVRWGGYRLRSYYKCSCGAVISSKTWKTKHADPMASKQKWYCLACGRKYATAMGQLVELLTPGNQLLWMYADIPNKDVEDIRALALEKEKRDKVSSAADLYSQIASYAPATGHGVLRPATVGDLCSWALETIPRDQWDAQVKMMAMMTPAGHSALSTGGRWDWMQFFNFLQS